MAEQKTNMTDEQLAQGLRKSKGGNLVLVVIGGVVLGLGQMVQGKSKEQAGRQTFDSIAPDIVGTAFENVQMNPAPPLLDANDTNIPLPSHTHCSGSGYIRGTYRGLTTELCTVRLTEVSEFQREETGLWEKNEAYETHSALSLKFGCGRSGTEEMLAVGLNLDRPGQNPHLLTLL